MRAIYIEIDLNADSLIFDNKDKVHHLTKVVRVKVGSVLLLLDGKGNKREYIITEITKNSLSLEARSDIENLKSTYKVSFLIGKTKKDALDSIIKSCVELGANGIHIVETKYSQSSQLKKDRVDRIIVSAMEQSNNPLKPEVSYKCKLNDFLFEEYDHIVTFHPNGSKLTKKINGKVLIVIGPEGGFCNTEINMMEKMATCKIIALETPILRAKTAVNVAFGYVYNSLIN